MKMRLAALAALFALAAVLTACTGGPANRRPESMPAQGASEAESMASGSEAAPAPEPSGGTATEIKGVGESISAIRNSPSAMRTTPKVSSNGAWRA